VRIASQHAFRNRKQVGVMPETRRSRHGVRASSGGRHATKRPVGVIHIERIAAFRSSADQLENAPAIDLLTAMRTRNHQGPEKIETERRNFSQSIMVRASRYWSSGQ